MSGQTEFFQDGPILGNQFTDDEVLCGWLARKLPVDLVQAIRGGLVRLGERAVTDMPVMAADALAHPPRHVPYDAWGRRIDRIDTAQGWEALHRVAAEEGIVATAYERAEGSFSRVHQFARLYLYNPSSAICSCPMAMTDGAARVLEVHAEAVLRERVLPHLISRDPGRFWTSGQWMTERSGGSDVSGTATVAEPDGRGGYRLFGTKWFTSATTAQCALTLARDETAGADAPLSLFFLETRDPSGALDHIRVNRLKDKLGTRALPTAELTLEGTPAVRVGEPGRGVRNISTVLNITRLYNSVCAVSYMRRGLALAEDYATRRRAFGSLLTDLPLHAETLADLRAEFAAAFHLVFELGLLAGREETESASSGDRALLRLLTPVAKLYTAKQSIAVASEVLECFGGAGYIEDTGLPELLRDCQVLSIWEGTTNVLSLDVLRAAESAGVMETFLATARDRLLLLDDPRLEETTHTLRAALARVEAYIPAAQEAGPERMQAGARRFAYSLARVWAGVLLSESVASERDPILSARLYDHLRRWCRQPLTPLPE